MNNQLLNSLLEQTKRNNPQGFQIINTMMQSGTNPQAFLKQVLGNAKPEQIEGLISRAKQLNCPDSILKQIQNIKN